MKPTCPAEAATKALHKVRGYDHEWEPGCCGSEPLDRLEALDLIDSLAEEGWFLASSVSLPSSAPRGRRETSRKAAASIADLSGGMRGVYELVACNGSHGLTDEQINDQYPGFAKSNGFPQIAPDSPRKRRESLTPQHLMDSGRTRPTRSGNEAIVWVARGSLEVAA